MHAQEFGEPFRHWLCRDVAPAELVAAARAAIPPADSPGWVRYDNACERGKWAMEDPAHLPGPWRELLGRLESPGVVAELSRLAGVPLQPDPARRGAGLHVMFPGGRLAPHLDYAAHPSGLERRVNLILFLDTGPPHGGGALELCDPAGTAVRQIYPHAGTAVVWECGDDTVHGVERLNPEARPRVTAAAYYLAPPRPGCSRKRALFLPPR